MIDLRKTCDLEPLELIDAARLQTMNYLPAELQICSTKKWTFKNLSIDIKPP